MKREFLGDSFDAVKRMWRDILQGWAPLYADARFIPQELRQDFTRLMIIPIFINTPTNPFSLFNDPDTGIRLPGEKNQSESRTHISVSSIEKQLQIDQIKCVVTFDQSHYRHKGSHQNQRTLKIHAIRDKGFHAFYYVSHAPFLFAAPSDQLLKELKGIITAAGIPMNRIEEG